MKSTKTIPVSEVSGMGATVGMFAVLWISRDEQTFLWLGVGNTERRAEEEAEWEWERSIGGDSDGRFEIYKVA